MKAPLTPPERRHFDLDEMELHSDIAIGSESRKSESAPTHSGSTWVMRITIVLLVGALLFFGYRTYTLTDELSQLQSNKGQVDASLSQTQNVANSLHSDLEQTKDELKSTRIENKDLRRELDQRKRNIANLKGQVKDAKADVRTAEKERKAVSKRLKSIESNLVQTRQKAKKDVADLDAKITQLTSDWDLERQSLLGSKEKAENTLKRERSLWENQSREEAQASMALIEERATLKKENAELKADLARAHKDLLDNKDLVQDLSGTSRGQLVPYTNDLITPQVTYREPFNQDHRIPRKFNPVAFLILVNEIGAVENAMVVPNQSAEQVLVAALLGNISKWKFRPPVLNGVKVKYWHTLVLSSR